MLALLGAVTVVVLLLVIMLNRMSALLALIAVPVVAALIGGFGLGTSKFILAGISSISPVAGMFVFAILYFGIMTSVRKVAGRASGGSSCGKMSTSPAGNTRAYPLPRRIVPCLALVSRSATVGC